MRIVKLLLSLLLLLVIAAGVLLWTLPAEVAYRQVADAGFPVTLSGVRGSVWDGHADAVGFMGRDLGEVNWEIARLPLLRGIARADLRLRGVDIDAVGKLARYRNGALDLEGVRIQFPAQLLQPALDIPLDPAGLVNISIDTARLHDGRLSNTIGTARWTGVALSRGQGLQLPDILGDFASRDDGSIAGSVHDDGRGALEVSGTFAFNPLGYDLRVRLAPRHADDLRTREMLQHLGEQQPDGSTLLLASGRTLPWAR